MSASSWTTTGSIAILAHHPEILVEFQKLAESRSLADVGGQT
jgi:hypothetical protein